MPAKDERFDHDGLCLTAFLPGQPGQLHWLEPGRRYAVGRSPDADVCLDHASVSRIHLLLEDAGNGWLATDQVSKNGTRLDGRPIDRAVISSPGWLEAGGIPLLVRPAAAESGSAGRSGHDDGGVEPGPDWGTLNSDALDHAVRELARLSGCERAGLWQVLEDGGCRPVVQLGDAEPAPSMTAIRRAAIEGISEFCSDTDGALALAGSESISTGGIRALLAMPIFRGEQVIAVAYADSLKPGKLFTRHDADLLEAVIRQLRLILDTAWVRDNIHAIQRSL